MVDSRLSGRSDDASGKARVPVHSNPDDCRWFRWYKPDRIQSYTESDRTGCPVDGEVRIVRYIKTMMNLTVTWSVC